MIWLTCCVVNSFYQILRTGLTFGQSTNIYSKYAFGHLTNTR
ncbi:hypothetical protein J715_4308 [Acinetobacter baumannii 1571545]|nr:hypothetical protein J715_4308 [Acinetobacter baumannii 1571545]